jgi:hypothetical protein
VAETQQNSWLDERNGGAWSVRPGLSHPFAAGVLCLALAVGSWYGLLWGFRQTTEVAASSPEARRVDLGPDTTSSSLKRVPAAAPPAAPKPSVPQIVRNPAPRPKLSPFRLSHPWAAPSGGQYYYPSRCPATLSLPDLLFFRTEAEAHARGFTASRLPGCE